jgi:hypothetical protein
VTAIFHFACSWASHCPIDAASHKYRCGSGEILRGRCRWRRFVPALRGNRRSCV